MAALAFYSAHASYTIFAPTDASLFALDMIQMASSYNETLRLHFLPLRLSLSDLRSISSGSILPTHLPYSAFHLTTDPLQVTGVDVALPDLFYSRHVAIQGLVRIVSLNSVLFEYGERLGLGFGSEGESIGSLGSEGRAIDTLGLFDLIQ
ncbi:hypothetical protein ACLB2K_059843 [Fragaria x ananassa]